MAAVLAAALVAATAGGVGAADPTYGLGQNQYVVFSTTATRTVTLARGPDDALWLVATTNSGSNYTYAGDLTDNGWVEPVQQAGTDGATAAQADHPPGRLPPQGVPEGPGVPPANPQPPATPTPAPPKDKKIEIGGTKVVKKPDGTIIITFPDASGASDITIIVDPPGPDGRRKIRVVDSDGLIIGIDPGTPRPNPAPPQPR